MIKNTLKTLSLCVLSTLVAAPCVHAQDYYGDLTIKHQLTSVVELDSDSTISVYNTGLNLDIQDTSGLGADFRGAVDGPIDQINSKDFQLGKFIKQLDVKYKIDSSDAVILLSVGKMPTGAKTNVTSPTQLGGVMGIRLSIQPKKIPLIEEWLKENNFKIDRIDITRYNAESGDRIDLNDLNNTNMTAYAAYLSHNNNMQTFFIYKKPDANNPFGVTSKSLGVVYMPEVKLNPQFFAMKHQSDAAFMDLDLLVLSAGIEVQPNVRTNLTYARAVETMSNTDVKSYDISVSKVFKKTKGFNFTTTLGARVDEGTSENKIVYFRLEAKY